MLAGEWPIEVRDWGMLTVQAKAKAKRASYASPKGSRKRLGAVVKAPPHLNKFLLTENSFEFASSATLRRTNDSDNIL